MSNTHTAILIAIMAVVTMLLRFLPFMIFRDRETPSYITFLGKYLPYSIMGMLVVYCLKGVSVTVSPWNTGIDFCCFGGSAAYLEEEFTYQYRERDGLLYASDTGLFIKKL